MSGQPVCESRSPHELYMQPVDRADPTATQIETTPCEVCGRQSVHPVFSLPGTRFITMQCNHCGLGSLCPSPTLDEISSFYPPHYYGSEGRKFFGVIERLVRWVGARHARFFANQIRPGGRFLDIGCGRGITLHALADAGFQVHGFEVCADAVEGVDSRIQIRVAPSLAEAAFPEQFFDEAILWHVLEHIPHPRATLREVHRILKPGGVLIVAVPNFSSWQARWTGPAWFHLDPPRHLFHFPLSGLKQLLESVGFHCSTEHHFSLRQNPFGWIQSVLNLCHWLPRNGLYVILHRAHGSMRPFTMWTRIQLWMLCWLLTPFALVLSVIEALFRQGATVHVVAYKGSNN